MRRLTILNILLTGLLCPAGWLTVSAQSSTITNIRLTVDERAGVVRILYDLNSIRPNDSVSVVLSGAKSGRIVPRSVQGDIGRTVKAGPNRSITWDAVKDNVNVDEEVSVIFQLTPAPVSSILNATKSPERRPDAESSVRTKRSLVVPVIGLVAAVGLGGYSAYHYLANRDDVEAYDAIPFIESDEDAQQVAELQRRIEERNRKMLLPSIGAGVLLVADVAYLLLVKPKPRRTTLNLRMQSGAPAVGFRHTF